MGSSSSACDAQTFLSTTRLAFNLCPTFVTAIDCFISPYRNILQSIFSTSEKSFDKVAEKDLPSLAFVVENAVWRR